MFHKKKMQITTKGPQDTNLTTTTVLILSILKLSKNNTELKKGNRGCDRGGECKEWEKN